MSHTHKKGIYLCGILVAVLGGPTQIDKVGGAGVVVRVATLQVL